jgi:hypothetical protein
MAAIPSHIFSFDIVLVSKGIEVPEVDIDGEAIHFEVNGFDGERSFAKRDKHVDVIANRGRIIREVALKQGLEVPTFAFREALLQVLNRCVKLSAAD